MSDNKEYCITSGAFAKLCNTTRDTLRYYEKEGILVPHKDAENHYGYYSYAQITSFHFISSFRNLGCSVSEIKEFLLAETPEAFDPFINKQYNGLLRLQMELEHNIASLSMCLLLVDKMRSCTDSMPILSSIPGPLRFYQTAIIGTAYHAGDLIEDLHTHISSCREDYKTNTFPIGVSMLREDFLNENYRYHHLVSFTKSEGEHTIPLPSEQILCCVYGKQSPDITFLYKKIADYANLHSLAMCSDIYSISLVNVVYPNDSHQYLKFIFVCVCKK